MSARTTPNFPSAATAADRAQLLRAIPTWAAAFVAVRAAWRTLEVLHAQAPALFGEHRRTLQAICDNAVGAALVEWVLIDTRIMARLPGTMHYAPAPAPACATAVQQAWAAAARAAEIETAAEAVAERCDHLTHEGRGAPAGPVADQAAGTAAARAIEAAWSILGPTEQAEIDRDLRAMHAASSNGSLWATRRVPRDLLPALRPLPE